MYPSALERQFKLIGEKLCLFSVKRLKNDVGDL